MQLLVTRSISQVFFSRASAKAECDLSSLSSVCMYIDLFKTHSPTPWKWHFYWVFLDFKSRFGFTTKN